MSVMTLRIEGKLEQQLNHVVKELRKNRTRIIKEALKEYLEDTIDYEIARDRMRDKNDPILTSEQARKLLHAK